MNVLCAADIMQTTRPSPNAGTGTGAGKAAALQVAPTMPVRELMRLQAEEAQALEVVADGKTLGWLGAEEIFTAILREVRASGTDKPPPSNNTSNNTSN